MAKLDLKKEYRELYKVRKDPELVEVPPLQYLMIDGEGDPNTAQAYKNAVEALFSLSYTLKFMVKLRPGGADYGVMPLEGLWWTESMEDFSVERKDGWKWTSLMLQPEFITPELVEEARAQAAAKKELPALPLVRLERLEEGRCAQVLHIGPYAAEGPTVERLHGFILEQGLSLRGKHHEIYLGDPRRAAPDKLQTIIRQPVE